MDESFTSSQHTNKLFGVELWYTQNKDKEWKHGKFCQED